MHKTDADRSAADAARVGPPTSGRIEQRARFDVVRYANCWEDADVLVAALRPAPGMRVLSIASAGDNALALAAEGAQVIAADLSLAQLACCELRIAALRDLSYDAALAFLGVRASSDRATTYAALKRHLSPAAAAFWDGRPDDVAAGIMHAGRFENYFRAFRTRVLPLVHSRRRVQQLLAEKDEAARRAFYDGTWNNLRWRLLFRVFFSRFVMGRMGRDPEFFRYVEGSVSDRILERAKYALTVLPTHGNPYLTYILTGNFAVDALPRYLRPEHYDKLRAGLDRVSLHRGSIEQVAVEYADKGFDAYNLSDIFEYIDEPTALDIYAKLLSTARPGARLAYWNTLVPRACPPAFRGRVTPMDALARQLLARDFAFFYNAFHVDEVR